MLYYNHPVKLAPGPKCHPAPKLYLKWYNSHTFSASSEFIQGELSQMQYTFNLDDVLKVLKPEVFNAPSECNMNLVQNVGVPFDMLIK